MHSEKLEKNKKRVTVPNGSQISQCFLLLLFLSLLLIMIKQVQKGLIPYKARCNAQIIKIKKAMHYHLKMSL